MPVDRELVCGFVVASPNTLVPFVSYVPSLARLNVLFLVGRTRWAAQPPVEDGDENDRRRLTANPLKPHFRSLDLGAAFDKVLF